ncbi:thioredoxin family protein [Humibacillus xanthopallidus]|uniref:thioredoxin family protein n=1 Tax=Humibacillus xanthopallidus TaxID=412689 RepID=UPI00384EEAD7
MTAPRPVLAVVASGLLLALAGCGTAAEPSATTPAAASAAATSTMADSSEASPTTSMTTPMTETPTSAPAAASAGSYIDYATYAQDPAAATGKVVLFFHATWCPICREVEESLTSAPVPAGLTVVKVDFDDAGELRQRYGVTIQHTFVQVDPAGRQLAKWSTGTTADEILGKTV